MVVNVALRNPVAEQLAEIINGRTKLTSAVQLPVATSKASPKPRRSFFASLLTALSAFSV